VLFEASIKREPDSQAAARAELTALRTKLAPPPAAEAPRPAQVAAKKPAKPPETRFSREYRSGLVQVRDDKVVAANLPELGTKKYYAIYFSAHWCPPCRGFTPKLVKFYNDKQEEYGSQFEVIFVSLDNDERQFEEYMIGAAMPWPAVRYTDNSMRTDLRRRYAGRGIPCLVLVDANGDVLSDSYVDGQYRGPVAVMTDLGTRLAGN
jgi:nucleoredoxin